MLRIAIALLHRRCTSSWSRAKTRRPVPIPSRVAERAVMRRLFCLDRRVTSWPLELALYARVPSLERGPIPPPSAIVTEPGSCMEPTENDLNMASQELQNQLWYRSGGRCECTSNCHSEWNRCNAPLANGWHVHHVKSVVAGGADSAANTLALCIPCHENTRSYGRNLTR